MAVDMHPALLPAQSLVQLRICNACKESPFSLYHTVPYAIQLYATDLNVLANSMRPALPHCNNTQLFGDKQPSGVHQLRCYVALGPAAAAAHLSRSTVVEQQASGPPVVNYSALLDRHKHGGCPALLLAPMENLADRPCRLALKEAIGGFDEACTEFIRVPRNSDHPNSIARGITASYDACELGDVPIAAQLMGSNTEVLAKAAERLVHRKGAPRVDLNCGCPANTVTGGGAGSSLLRNPEQLHKVVSSLVQAVGSHVPVSVKMRSGFVDTALYQDNLLAVQEAGAAFVTIHPRTKQQSYNGRADWSLIAAAKQLLNIPVVGNGDVISVSSALAMLHQTGCDGLMIGRGALQDPLLFQRLKQHFQQQTAAVLPGHANINASRLHGRQQQLPFHMQQQDCPSSSLVFSHADNGTSYSGSISSDCSNSSEAAIIEDFLRRYASYGSDGKPGGSQELTESGRIGRLKKVMKYIFSTQPQLRTACSQLLRVQPGEVTSEHLLNLIIQQVHLHWQAGGLVEEVLVNHYTLSGISKAEQTWQMATRQHSWL